MKKKFISLSFVLALLLLIIFQMFVMPVRAFFPPTYHWWTSGVTINPSPPSEIDKVNVTVTFHFYSSPPGARFGNVTQIGNVFYVDVTVHDDYWAFQVLHDDEYTYHLGRLPAGSYQFKVYVIYELEDWPEIYFLEKSISFIVKSLGPKADFTYSPSIPRVNQTITFDASASLPGWNGTHDMPIVNYAWNFGDGTPIVIEADPVVTHNYTAEGTYTVTLNITDSQGLWNTTAKLITVLGQYPMAKFTYSPTSPDVNLPVTFDASSSEPGWNGTHFTPIVNYTWNFGDGNITSTSDPVIIHNYTLGTYTVNLNVTDTQGNWNTTSQTIIVCLAEFSLVTLYKVHLDLDCWLSEGANLTVAFYTYDGVYQGNMTIWTGITPAQVVLSTNITHPQGEPIEMVNLVLTDDFGNVLQTVTKFLVGKSHLAGRLAELDYLWTVPGADRPAIIRELVAIDGQWPYAPP